MEHVQQVVNALIDHFGYFGLFVGMALGNTGVPIGTELLLPTAGALTATGHLSSLWLTVAVALAGELGWWLGRLCDRKVRRHTRNRTLWKVHPFYARTVVARSRFLRALGKLRNLHLPLFAGRARHLRDCGRHRGDESCDVLFLDFLRLAYLLHVARSCLGTRLGLTSIRCSRCFIKAPMLCSRSSA